MALLRVGTPDGEVVISGASDAEQEILFDAFAKIGWHVEVRRSQDKVKRGWLGAPLRTNQP